MKKQLRIRYDMLKRVVEFGHAHRELFPDSSTGGQALAAVAAAVAAIDSHATEKLLAARDGQRAKIVARQALKAAMLDIARTARLARRTRRLSENRFLMPRRESYDSLIRAARTFIDEGEARLDVLVTLGLPPTVFADLRALLDALEATLDTRTSGRRTVAEGQTGILKALADGTEAALVLDAVVTNALKDDPVTFAGWIRSRRIVDGSGTRPRQVDVTPSGIVAGTVPPAEMAGPEPGAPVETTTDAPPTDEPAQTIAPIDPLRRAS